MNIFVLFVIVGRKSDFIVVNCYALIGKTEEEHVFKDKKRIL